MLNNKIQEYCIFYKILTINNRKEWIWKVKYINDNVIYYANCDFVHESIEKLKILIHG
jgi:hypothetical protein